MWNTKQRDRQKHGTQWGSWYCLISWSMHEWFGFDVQCCCIDHFLKTSIFSHVLQAAVQILRFLRVEGCRIWLKFAVQFIFISALVILLTTIHPFLHQQTEIPIYRQRGVMRMYMYYNSTWGFPTAGAERERGERGTCVIVDPCSSNTSVSWNRPGQSMCPQIKLWIRSIQVWAVLESAARKL